MATLNKRRIGRGIGERRNGRVDRGDAEFDRFETTDGAKSGIAVGVELDRFIFRFTEDQRNQPPGGLWG